MSEFNTVEPQSVRRAFRHWILGMLAFSVVLGVLHVLFHDVTAGRTYWFNLDKERNVATWFNGIVFLLFGLSAFVAYVWEVKRNDDESPAIFRLPILWVGVGLGGLWLSLDEITILHENLFWREVRLSSDSRGAAWRYLTQWQILFGPAIFLAVAYFAVFFSNRFAASRQARRLAVGGVGCWILALLLEGIRGTIREAGGTLYTWQVLVEEQLEIIGGILLLAAVVSYVLDIALDFSDERREQLRLASGFLTRRAMVMLSASAVLLVFSAGTIFYFAQRQADAGDRVPGLFKRAVGEGQDSDDFGAWPEVSPGPGPEIWFEDIGALPDVDLDTFGRFVTARVRGDAGGAISGELEQDGAPRIVFLSVGNVVEQARVFLGAGDGIGAAIEDARNRAESSGARLSGSWLKLDVVADVSRSLTHSEPPLPLEIGVHGLAFDRPWGIAFIPDELAAFDLVDKDKDLDGWLILKYLETRDREAAAKFVQMLRPREPVPYRLFATLSLFITDEGVVPLYRGHRTYDSITADQLIEASRRAGRYLKGAVLPDGKFVYSYRPETHRVSDKYNMLRHAGTIYSMMELYEVTRDPELLAAAERAIDYMMARMTPCGEDGQYTCLVDADSIKLGGAGLAIIALAKHREVTGETQHVEVMQSLAEWIMSVQKPDGEFGVHKLSYPGERVEDFTSAYYPGEVLLALCRLYVQEPDPRLLDAAEAGARWLIEVRDAGKSVDDLYHDHWFLYALNDLHRLRQRDLFVEQAMRISQAIVNGQNREPRFPDWLGSYYKPPRSTPTAIRTEGLTAAYALARDFGRPEMLEPIFGAIELGVRFDLQTQIGPERAMYFIVPEYALGGFSVSLTEPEVRIDYVQHNISALLATARILEERN